MFFVIGVITVFACVLGGYAAMGGKIYVLWQPFEYVIICGAACGAYIIGNSKSILSHTMGALKDLIGGSPYTKDHFIELLCALYAIFKLAKGKGMLTLEAHIENPEDSEIFNHFSHVSAQHHPMEFLCDYLRMMTLGSDNPHQMEDLMNEELDVHHHHDSGLADALQGVADGMPALGIVAAVLGVIKTMGSITEPPEVLGKLIGGALVGTFAGVFIAYGFVGPMATSLKHVQGERTRYYECIKAGLLAYLNGYSPAVCVEFARKSLIPDMRPSFIEVEEALNDLPSFG